MRVIAGRCRGRRLASVPATIRPTPDRLRESLFNALGNEVTDSVWLDALAGSGAVGIEALSRGAQHIVFNDRREEAILLIERNLKRCGITKGFEICQKDVFVLFRTLQRPRCDYLFLDPPYRFGRYRKLLAKALQCRALKEDAFVILELFKRTRIDFIPSGLELLRTLTAGDSHLLLLRRS